MDEAMVIKVTTSMLLSGLSALLGGIAFLFLRSFLNRKRRKRLIAELRAVGFRKLLREYLFSPLA
jgi:hypothetical protein